MQIMALGHGPGAWLYLFKFFAQLYGETCEDKFPTLAAAPSPQPLAA
jgi:hypothetical protein